jgi:hypothetical protein
VQDFGLTEERMKEKSALLRLLNGPTIENLVSVVEVSKMAGLSVRRSPVVCTLRYGDTWYLSKSRKRM